MRDYPTLHLNTKYSKGTVLLLLFYISQSILIISYWYWY